MSADGIDGEVLADEYAAGFAHMAGTEPLEITPWDPETDIAAGDPIVVLSDERSTDVVAERAGTFKDEEFEISTPTPLVWGATYKYLGDLYTAEQIDTERLASSTRTLPSGAILRIHAS